MKLLLHLTYLLLAFLFSAQAKKSPEKVRLSSVKSLTLRQGLKTANNRVAAIPQLSCVGGTAKGLYEIDVLRCKNAGSSYDEADVEWTCTASLPAEFKLGSTDVTCEGFSGPDDPYILKGSCGVEYRLMLTKLGEEKYGRPGNDLWNGFPGRTKAADAAGTIFWLAFVGVLVWMVYSAFFRQGGPRRLGGPRGGFGGGRGGGDDDDPPPPYDPRPPPSKSRAYNTYPPGAQAAPQGPGWRPGFWTGALGGALGGYMMGNRGNGARQSQYRAGSTWDNGEGSSNGGFRSGRRSSGGTPSSSSSFGSTRYESTGFGGTTRR